MNVYRHNFKKMTRYIKLIFCLFCLSGIPGLVQQSSALTVSPSQTNLTISASYGHSIAPFELIINADHNYTVTTSTQGGDKWLKVSPTNGIPNQTSSHVVYFDISELGAAGSKLGWISISEIGGVSRTINLTLSVNQTPIPAWNVGDVVPGLNVQVNQGESVADRSFQLHNASAVPRGPMRYEVEVSDELRNWVSSITPMSGISSGELHRLTVKYDVASLPAGAYGGNLSIRCFDVLSGASVGVLATNLELLVIGRAALGVSPDDVSAELLEHNSVTNVLRIWNDAAPPRRNMRYQITTPLSWVQFIPDTGVVLDGTAAVSVVFASTSLEPGDYTGELMIEAWDEADERVAIGSPMRLSANLTVSSRQPINYEPPEVLGVPNIGRTLQAGPGIWRRMDRLSFEYQWERADNPQGTGQIVLSSWSTNAEYQVAKQDRGKYLRVRVKATDSDPVPLSVTVASEYRSCKIVPTVGDFDGDGRTDLWFYDPGSGYWHGYLTGGFYGKYFFGIPGRNLISVPGDYDGNGFIDLALYDPATGAWHAWLLPQGTYATGVFGWPGAECQPGDYNGDGTTDLGIYSPDTGRWYIYYVNSGKTEEITIGGIGSTGVPGDYDGDGITDLAVYNETIGVWTVRGSRDGIWEEFLGGPGAVPAPGDYDGDGKLDIAVYWQASNKWQMRMSATGVLEETSFGVHNGAGVPMQGYYDDDRFCDPAHAFINGDFIIWCVRQSSMTNYIPYRGQTYQISADTWRVSW